MDLQQLLEKTLANAPGALAIGFVVWWTLRDHGKILRSINLRMAKSLEVQRGMAAAILPGRSSTPPGGVRTRGRSHSDSDQDSISLPRTMSEDLEQR